MNNQDRKRHRSEGRTAPKRSPSPTTVRARQLRHEMTDAERKLSRYLRAQQVHGVKFRRQEPLATYIVDFCCFDPKLVIEVDGGQHAEHVAYDAQRTAVLERMGYRVIRFWNNEVLENIEGVFERICEEVERLPRQRRK